MNTGGYRIPLEPPRPRGHPGGLIMFGPIAAAYPQHARAMLSLDMTNFAPLVLFGVLSLSFTLGVLKAANSVWGTMSESTYTLVAGRGQTIFLISTALGRQHFFFHRFSCSDDGTRRFVALPSICCWSQLLPSHLGTLHTIQCSAGGILHDLLICRVLQASDPCWTTLLHRV